MATITFCPQQPWALPPDKLRVDRAAARAERDAYETGFRHKRIARLPADCPPWVLGQELGWTVRSPITATLTPLDDTDFGVPDEEAVPDVARRAQRTQMWKHGQAWIATADTTWLRLHDYRTPQGWESMFLPNGSGTVEWRLGWSARIPDQRFLMVMPPPTPNPHLDVPVGIIAARTLNAMNGPGGISIAVRPTAPVTLHRGDPLARIVLLHPDTLRANATHTQPGEAS
ncbi:hypothetical protein ACIQUY_34985 [Streptomyces sp. NPDC090231]|uniref:hypothetical protein n=1 Tax=unclassified Streptomyces TaxID=2593676 RepID=UPI002E0E816B|nr:hypothetical protein OG384_36575 [Streptomyces sp. NBC_01324]